MRRKSCTATKGDCCAHSCGQIPFQAKCIAECSVSGMLSTINRSNPRLTMELTSNQGLLVQGASEYDLPLPYQDYIKSLPSFTKNISKYEEIGAKLFLL